MQRTQFPSPLGASSLSLRRCVPPWLRGSVASSPSLRLQRDTPVSFHPARRESTLTLLWGGAVRPRERTATMQSNPSHCHSVARSLRRSVAPWLRCLGVLWPRRASRITKQTHRSALLYTSTGSEIFPVHWRFNPIAVLRFSLPRLAYSVQASSCAGPNVRRGRGGGCSRRQVS